MPDPPRRPRPEARKLLDDYTTSDSVKTREQVLQRLEVLAEQATALLKKALVEDQPDVFDDVLQSDSQHQGQVHQIREWWVA